MGRLVRVLLVLLLLAPAASAQTAADWYTAGANTARTSYTTAEVSGQLSPLWSVPIEPYILPRVQVVAVGNYVYLSTARGLYCFVAATGVTQWVYPTRFPLGHSPTIDGSVAYVGGFDKRIHAVNITTGARVWISDQAGAGFETSPLVTGGLVIAGNRDGKMYAFNQTTGALSWSYQTDGPILTSAALYGNNLYFASEDAYAYALVAATGALVWKSAKLPGAGFNSWWPVVYVDKNNVPANDRIIFSGSVNYRTSPIGLPSGYVHLHEAELNDVWPNGGPPALTNTYVGTAGTASGPWASGTPTLATTRIVTYFTAKPHRRTVFILNPATGAEVEQAPVLLQWAHSGARFPPVMGADGALYQPNVTSSDDGWIGRGTITGWVPGINYLAIGTTTATGTTIASDEPTVVSAGGNLIFDVRAIDREMHSFDVRNHSQRWDHFSYNLSSLVPGYNAAYYWKGNTPGGAAGEITVPFGPVLDATDATRLSVREMTGGNGVYGLHGDQNPPIPHGGRVFFHRGNSLMAWTTGSPTLTIRAEVPISTPPTDTFTAIGEAALRTTLNTEIDKILAAGHLRPGYVTHGLQDYHGQTTCGDQLSDYFHTPVDTLYTLLRVLPFTTGSRRTSLQTYIQTEFTTYPPYSIDHIGWSGAAREAFTTPSEIVTQMAGAGTSATSDIGYWTRNPLLHYVMWQYAAAGLGTASTLHTLAGTPQTPPSDATLLDHFYVLNAYIAGYWGHRELERLAGVGLTGEATLTRLLALRRKAFTDATAATHTRANGLESWWKDQPFGANTYCHQYALSDQWAFLTPPLGDYLYAYGVGPMTTVLNTQDLLVPYWRGGFIAAGLGENAISFYHDTVAMFQAKALVLQKSATDLEQDLNAPAFARGDLYYLQNLAAVLEAYTRVVPTAPTALAVIAPTLCWDHPGTNVSSFKVDVDAGTITDVSLPTTATCTTTAPGMTAYGTTLSLTSGSHQVRVWACNQTGRCGISTAVTVVQ